MAEYTFNPCDMCERTNCKICIFHDLFIKSIEAEPVKWLPASEPPDHYRDEYGELIPLLVCEDGTDYPYRAFYDGRNWGDGYVVVPVKWWMPLPKPPKDGGADHADR